MAADEEVVVSENQLTARGVEVRWTAVWEGHCLGSAEEKRHGFEHERQRAGPTMLTGERPASRARPVETCLHGPMSRPAKATARAAFASARGWKCRGRRRQTHGRQAPFSAAPEACGQSRTPAPQRQGGSIYIERGRAWSGPHGTRTPALAGNENEEKNSALR